jgi:hypothetical protein
VFPERTIQRRDRLPARSRSGEGRVIPPYKLQKTKNIHIRKGGIIMAAEEIKVYSTPT